MKVTAQPDISLLNKYPRLFLSKELLHQNIGNRYYCSVCKQVMSRRPSVTEVNRMNKDELKQSLKAILSDLNKEHETGHAADVITGDDAASITQLLTAVLKEVKELRKEKASLKKEVDSLKEENQQLSNSVFQHQRFLESLDAEKRNKNLIVLGVAEDTNLTVLGTGGAPVVVADQDQTKVSLLLQKIGHKEDIDIVEITRLGKKSSRPNARPRPIKVVTSTPQERKAIIADAKKLKDAGAIFNKIYINKDIHPLVRKELNRIRKVEKDEKLKPENQARIVKYDNETRTVTD